MTIILVLVLSYFIGAIPFAFIFTKLLTGKDVRTIGSGNVGATNATRALGLKYGILVGFFDILKGFLAVLLIQVLIPEQTPDYILYLGAIMAIIGHNWSVFLKFTGGKGVATTFGVLLKLFPLVCLIYALIWLIIVLVTRYVSLASIAGAIALPILALFFKGGLYYLLFTSFLTLFIIIRHHSNIRRLLSGSERRINWPFGVNKG